MHLGCLCLFLLLLLLVCVAQSGQHSFVSLWQRVVIFLGNRCAVDCCYCCFCWMVCGRWFCRQMISHLFKWENISMRAPFEAIGVPLFVAIVGYCVCKVILSTNDPPSV